MIAITQHHSLYKKLMRTQANSIVRHINTLAHKGFSVAKACKLFGLKTSWYNYHKRKINCPLNAMKNCFKQHPLQLTLPEQSNIKQWIHQAQNAGKTLTHLYYEALNKNIVFCSKTTFFMYANVLVYKRAFRKPKAKRKIGHRANAVFEYLHIDTTYISTLVDGIFKVACVKDNFSKAPLHYNITETTLTSTFIKDTLQQTFDKYALLKRNHDIQIITDGGSENKGEVTVWVDKIKAPPCVKKITAKSEAYPFANNMIESAFNLLKNDFLKGEMVNDRKHLIKKMEGFMEHCQNRYFGELYGVTPLQVLNGTLPNKNQFKLQIAQAAKLRLIANKQFSGCTMPNCL